MDKKFQIFSEYRGDDRDCIMEINIKREKYVGFVFVGNRRHDAFALSMVDITDASL